MRPSGEETAALGEVKGYRWQGRIASYGMVAREELGGGGVGKAEGVGAGEAARVGVGVRPEAPASG